MQLGLIRDSGKRETASTRADGLEMARLADRLGLQHLRLRGLVGDDLDAVANATESIRIGLDARALAGQGPRAMAMAICDAQTRAAGRLVIEFPCGRLPEMRGAAEALETVSQTPCPQDGLGFAHPATDRMALIATGQPQEAKAAAACGDHVLSPAWLPRAAIARHWPAIVAGATHARLRARSARWHVARLVFVSDDPASVARYLGGPARRYLAAHGAPTDEAHLRQVAIAGSADHVSRRLADLRRRAGPFGVLHCVDPGLDPASARHTLLRLVREVMPALTGATPTRPKELERT
ncbi:hypothetical protein N9W17_05035 [Jannaschia sp.]|nr:hypothetical protein [Jannaschia sp.]